MRFDWLPVVTSMWRRRGKPLRVGTPGKNQRICVVGAFRWPNGPCRFAYGSKGVNTDLVLAMLTKLAVWARRSGKRIVLVLDHGSAHTSGRSQVAIHKHRSWLRVLWLPKYSSEQFNDIEGVWRQLKRDYFSRMLVRRRRDFFPRAVALLSRLERRGALRQMLRPRSRRT